MTTASKKDIDLLPKAVADKWKGPTSKLSFGLDETRFWWSGAGPRKALDGWMESFEWDDLGDAAPVITGSATLRQSLSHSPIPPIRAGDVIVCEGRDTPHAPWKELVRLRVSEPQRLASGQFTFQLANDASLLAAGNDSWHFPHDKAHSGGWRPDQIVAEVCRRSQVPLVIPKLGSPIKKFPPMLTSSPIDVINAAMRRVTAKNKDGQLVRKTLVRRFEGGTLYISERHYSPELMTLGPQLIDAALTETKRDGWATALTVRTVAEKTTAKDSKGKKKATHKGITVEIPGRKIVNGVTVSIAKSSFIKRYGYVHLVVYAHGATSAAEVKAEGIAHMARVLDPKRDISLTVPYISSLRRGAYIRLDVQSLGLKQIVFVSGISYSFSSGSAQMTVTCSFDDPVVAPPIDHVNQSSRNLGKKKKPKVTGAKLDKTTAEPPPKPGTNVHGVHILNS